MDETVMQTIPRYLNNELSQVERQRFELEMEKDEELARLVQQYNAIEKDMIQPHLYNQQDLALKETLEHLREKYFSNAVPTSPAQPVAYKKRKTSGWILPVIIILVLSLLAYLLFN